MPLSKTFAKLIPLLTITVLLLNLLAPVGIAFAQDANPPPEPPPAVEVVADEESVEEEAIEAPEEPEAANEPEAEQPTEEEGEAGDETSGEEPTGEQETAEGEEASEAQEEPVEANEPEVEAGEEAEPETEEENPVVEAVEALDEADAVLLDEEGEPLAMATQEAAEALAAPDPQFCPAGLSFGDVGCGASHTNMADAIADALTAAASGISGTIFVESGNFDNSGINDPIVLNGFTFGTSLTIQGNANGGGTTTFTTAFQVSGFPNHFSSLTFNDVTFDAGVSVNGVTGDLNFNNVIANADGGADAIAVSAHDGAVSLDNVTANNSFSASDGANIDSTSSATDASVTVTNSTFNGFVHNGLLVQSDGEINVSNVTANGNGQSGLDLNNSTSSNEAGITLNGVTANNNQQGAGLQITSSGDMTLNNVTANGNLDNGAVLSNPSGSEPNSIQVSNSNFNNNGANGTYAGLDIDTTGSITLNGVSANDNTGNGAQLINLNSTNNASVNVFNSNFNGNGISSTNSVGLLIESDGGAVTLDGVSASGNQASSFSYGLIIDNRGGDAPVTITNSVFNNNTGNSTGWGLSANSDGQITLNNVTANQNGALLPGGGNTMVGAQLNNSTGATNPAVIVENSNFNGNFGQSAEGLQVISSGAITLNHVTANNTTSYGGFANGAELVNSNGSDIDAPITITNSNFSNNGTTGLFISSQGDVYLHNVSANGNGTEGIFIDISSPSGAQDVSVICSQVKDNSFTGMTVFGPVDDLDIISTDTSGNGTSPLNTSGIININFGTTNCDSDPSDKQRDGKHTPLDPNEPTTIVLDLYPHSVTFPPMNLLECEGFVRSLFYASELPGELNAGDTFLRALKMHIEGCEIPEGGMFTIGFDIPATEQDNEFAVLVWDNSTESWVEVPGQMTEDGRYTVTWPTTGTFVLVTR